MKALLWAAAADLAVITEDVREVGRVMAAARPALMLAVGRIMGDIVAGVDVRTGTGFVSLPVPGEEDEDLPMRLSIEKADALCEDDVTAASEVCGGWVPDCRACRLDPSRLRAPKPAVVAATPGPPAAVTSPS